ncbi:glycosyltransferase [Cellulomonas sp. KRMCY2]|uniref:glycosyltransferase family 2 protein n=1 Tax=Cellulomonas sp. KRMCY2 TaxID=1304865 RepID=UPI0004A2451C
MTAGPPSARRVVVAMLTYRRPDDLRRAVPAFLAQVEAVDGNAGMLVVDNDPDGSAAEIVTGFGSDLVRYAHEPVPGIAAARNRALDESSDVDLLVFVDDDEHPTAGWLEAMLATYERHRAACVAGPVVSEFAADPEPWITAGRFFERRRMPTGTEITVAATNNLLIDMAQLRRHGVRFDEVFGLSGGSDTLLTRALVRRGAHLVWCDEAIVYDRVPTSRLTRQWVLHRARRSGNSASRVALVLAGSIPARAGVRVSYVARGMARIAAGSVRRCVGLVTRSATQDARGRRSTERGIGMMTGALGHVVYEYKRD